MRPRVSGTLWSLLRHLTCPSLDGFKYVSFVNPKFISSEKGRARVYHQDGKVSAIIATYIGKDGGAPSPASVLGADLFTTFLASNNLCNGTLSGDYLLDEPSAR